MLRITRRLKSVLMSNLWPSRDDGVQRGRRRHTQPRARSGLAAAQHRVQLLAVRHIGRLGLRFSAAVAAKVILEL